MYIYYSHGVLMNISILKNITCAYTEYPDPFPLPGRLPMALPLSERL